MSYSVIRQIRQAVKSVPEDVPEKIVEMAEDRRDVYLAGSLLSDTVAPNDHNRTQILIRDFC